MQLELIDALGHFILPDPWSLKTSVIITYYNNLVPRVLSYPVGENPGKEVGAITGYKLTIS